MRKLLLIILVLFLGSMLFHPPSGSSQGRKTAKKKPAAPTKPAVKIKPTAERPVAPAAQQLQGLDSEDTRVERDFFAQRAYPDGVIPPDVYERAMEQWRRLSGIAFERRTTDLQGRQPKMLTAVGNLAGVVWKPIGPSPVLQGTSSVNGRVNAIVVNPNNPNVIYMGAAGGGVWRSINGGANWTPLFDQQPSLGVGESNALAIDPSNTNVIYVGTSSRFLSQTLSQGLLKSTDGGGSWIVLGSDFPAGNNGNADNLFRGASINRVIVDPANSNILYLGASNGLFRSIDGGRNWTLGANGGGDAETLALDVSSPTNTRVLFAGVRGSGVRRSNDGGQTWTQVLSNATPAVAAVLTMNGWGFGKVAVALAPPATPPNANGVQVIYVTMQGAGVARDSAGNPILDSSGNTIPAPEPTGVFQSVDQGATWTQRPGVFAPGRRDTQGGFNLNLGVDPASPGDGVNDIVYYGAVGLFRSADAGANFANIGNGIHVDTHADWVFVLRPAMPSIVYTGNDGGIWRSTDNGATWSGTGMPGAPATINAGGFQTALFYNLDISQDATSSVTVGTLQDNGTPQTTGSLAWRDSQGGDGWDIAFDAVTLTSAFNSSGFWPAPCTRVFRSTDSGATFPAGVPSANDITPWGTTTDQGCYLAPLKIDPNNGGTLYVSGSQNLWQTRDGGASWRIITNSGGTGPIDVVRANSNNVVMAVGRSVFVSVNALAATVGPPSGVTFANITRDLPNQIVTRVAFDPNDPTVIYATLSGFNTGHIFRTTINGTTWTDISPALNVPFNAIALDGETTPTTIYVGTDLGVIRSVDGGLGWTTLDDIHFPNVVVTDLAFNQQAGILRAATFGRGVFELVQPDAPVIAINAENGLRFDNVCRGSSATLTLQVFNVGSKNLVINNVRGLFGSSDFTVLSNPATPLIIGPNAEVDFTIRFTPTSNNPQVATIRITSNDPAAPFFDLTVTGASGTARSSTVIADNGNFGDVCVGEFKDLKITINNSGDCDLRITGLTSSSPEFQVAGVMSFPLVVQSGDSTQIPIRFQPTSFGANKMSDITIFSNDPASPKVVKVSGAAPSATIVVNDPIIFDKTCPGNTDNKTLTIGNSGGCDLIVKSITSSSPEFKVAGVVPFPLVIPPGGTRDVTIQFMPMGFTVDPMRMATLTIMSNDLVTPNKTVKVIGTVPPPVIQAAPDPLDFGKVCLGTSKELPLVIRNTGECNLTVSSITFSSPEFKLASPPAFPLVIPPGGSRTVMVSFMPVGATGPRMATMTINSDDPATPMKVVTLKGVAPVSAIAVTGSMDFGMVTVGKFKVQFLNITNTEPCDLLITLICEIREGGIPLPSTDYDVVSPVGPSVLIPGGGTLPVQIRFKPQKKGPRNATLVVMGYDPTTSSIVLTAKYPLKGVGK